MNSAKSKLLTVSKFFAIALLWTMILSSVCPVFPQTEVTGSAEPPRPTSDQFSAEMQKWLRQHQTWRENYPNWYELTRYPELIVQDLEFCYGIQPKYATDIDNFLEIKIGGTGFEPVHSRHLYHQR